MAEQTQLQRPLSRRCEVIADAWYKAIARTSFVPYSEAEVRQRLAELTAQVIALLLAGSFDRGRAQAIGASLVRLHYVQPEALGRTQEVLARQLVEGLPTDQIVALQPRLTALLAGLTTGFFQQAYQTILTEQEQARKALTTALGRAEEALGLYRDHLEDLVQERTTALAEAVERLEQEIAERKRVEGVLRASEEQIRASLGEKEVLLQEIHHRVKNNLQIISSLLSLQSAYVQDQQALEMFRESQHRVRSMALVHEQLYQSQDLAKIDFAKHIRSLADELLAAYGASAATITLKIAASDVVLGIDMAIPCGLIVNELVSNALRHAFPEGREGEIHIALDAVDDDKLALIVRDNGVGLPKDLDLQNAKTLGLRLVNMLTRQLRGVIELDGNGGSAFKITFTK